MIFSSAIVTFETRVRNPNWTCFINFQKGRCGIYGANSPEWYMAMQVSWLILGSSQRLYVIRHNSKFVQLLIKAIVCFRFRMRTVQECRCLGKNENVLVLEVIRPKTENTNLSASLKLCVFSLRRLVTPTVYTAFHFTTLWVIITSWLHSFHFWFQIPTCIFRKKTQEGYNFSYRLCLRS